MGSRERGAAARWSIGYDVRMTTEKVAVTIPAETLKRARKEVRAGRAKSLSAFVSDAVAEKLHRDELSDVLDAMDAEHGAPGTAATEWARNLLRR